jgi:hypothetical protein
MRFQKGCIEINTIKDVPLLRQVLHCQLVTHEQLWRLSCVWACTNSRGLRSTGVCVDWSRAACWSATPPQTASGAVYRSRNCSSNEKFCVPR